MYRQGLAINIFIGLNIGLQYRPGLNGETENAGLKNVAPSKMHGWKVETAGPTTKQV